MVVGVRRCEVRGVETGSERGGKGRWEEGEGCAGEDGGGGGGEEIVGWGGGANVGGATTAAKGGGWEDTEA